MFEVGRLVARIQLEGAGTFGRDLRLVGKEFQGLSNEGKQAAGEIGRSLTGIGSAIIGMAGLTAKAAIDWETAWAGVTKTVDGTPAQLKNVENGLRDLTKVLPASHTEIAAVAEAAGQLGVETDNVVAFTKTMIDLGETTNLSANDAATALARFMNVMGTAQSEVSNLGSSVVELGNNYATTEAEIVSMASRLSGAARQVGLSEGETLGLAAALSSVGIEAEAGGTAFSKVMINIAQAADQGGDKLDAFADVAGMSAQKFAAQWKKDPGAAMAVFIKGLADAESQGKSTFGVIESLGVTEQRMRDALLKAAAASDQFTAAMSTGNTAYEENNALLTEAEKRYETVASKIRITGNNITEAAIGFGQVFLPAITDATEGISEFAQFMGALSPEWQSLISFAGLGGGAILLFGGLLLLAIPKIVAFRGALAILSKEMPILTGRLKGAASFLTGPWGIAFIAAAAGVQALTNYIDGLQASSEEITASLKSAKTAADLFAVAGKGKDAKYWTDVVSDLGDLDNVLQAAADQSENLFARFDKTHFGAFDTLKAIGAELATMADTDLPGAQNGFRLLAAETDGTDQSLWRLLSTMPAYRDALEVQAISLGKIDANSTEAERKTALLELAQGNAAQQVKYTAGAYDDAGVSIDDVTLSIEELIGALNEANGVQISAEEAAIRYADELRDVAAAARESSAGISLSTEEGTNNRAMLVSLAEAGQKAAQANLDAGGSAEEYRNQLLNSREAWIAQAMAFGASADEAQKLADKIYKIPSEKEIAITVATRDADNALNAFMRRWNGKSVNLTSSVSGKLGSGILGKADGGIVRYFAGGGTFRENHVAQIARAGTTRVWAEPETEGELYAPLAASKRQRSLSVIGQQLNEWGFDMVPRARGGSAATSSGSDAPMRIVGTLDLGGGLSAQIDAQIDTALNQFSDDVAIDAMGGSSI